MIKNQNVADDAQIAEHKVNLGSEYTGVEKFYCGTDGTAAYELAATRVPQDRLFTDIDSMINAMTAARGDVGFVLQNHTETITSAGAIAQDGEGLKIIGLGKGSMRPTITWGSTDNSATWAISGAGCVVKNIIGTTTDDGLTSAFVVSAADCELDIEWRDGSASIEAATAVLTTAAADRLKLKLKYLGYSGGNACVSPIILVGVDNANVEVDFYGKASTAVVEFKTTACTNINISGYFNNVGTSLTKNVVDTATGSTWKAAGWDGEASSWFSGGDNASLALDDASAIATLVGTANATTTDSLHGKIGTDTEMADSSLYDMLGSNTATTTDSINGKIGTDTEMADNSLYDLLGAGTKTLSLSSAIGADVDGTTTDTLHGKIGTDTEMADSSLYDLIGSGAKTLALSTAIGSSVDGTTTDTLHGKIGTDTQMADRSLFDLLGGDGFDTAFPSAAVPAADVSIAEVLRDIWDALRNGTGGAEPATDRGVMDYLGASPDFFVPGLGYIVTKTCDLSGANDDLFTVTGKVLITLITGEVTTVLSGAEAFQLRIKTDNVALCAATTIDTDADGTHYMLTGDFGDTMCGGSTPGLRAAEVNSLGARGAFEIGDAGSTCTIESNTTGNNGAILFTLCYLPLEASASVAAAA